MTVLDLMAISKTGILMDLGFGQIVRICSIRGIGRTINRMEMGYLHIKMGLHTEETFRKEIFKDGVGLYLMMVASTLEIGRQMSLMEKGLSWGKMGRSIKGSSKWGRCMVKVSN